MDKAYEPQKHDPKWQKFWDDQQISKPETTDKKHSQPTGKKFTIMMPPPNVTGVLHQGHALMLALEDTLIRWHRMQGDKTLYVPGTDHASIAVNMQVAKFLDSKGISYKEIGREKFLEECWKWINEYRPRIHEQIRTIGTSCDWTRVKFTMDEDLNKAVLTAFVELHKKGLIYRAERLVNWSPKGQTGLSDLEVVYEEREASLWHLKYPISGSKEFITVATTRPETMLGDVAVAVHPDDSRYKNFIGKNVKLPIVGREIPVIADSAVDKDFGTGAVKITPAHDHNDFAMGERHKLPKIVIFTKEAKIVDGLPADGKKLAGLDRFEARKKVVEQFESGGLLEKIEKHKNRVGLSERWQDVVEPFLSYQWYVKMDGMAKKAMKEVNAGTIEFVPKEFHNQFCRWMENIHDWCVSRQLWWGQQIPAYHCKCGQIDVALEKPTKCSKCGAKEMTQDPDVLDTWFSSGIWPFSTLGWPNTKSQDFKDFYPTSVLETGFDILFFWVARMVMMGLELTEKLPFTKVYMHPMVRDEHGQKMSKTKGNVKDPLDIIKNHGADTLRFTFNALCVQGRDLRLSEERIETYKFFINKVWNATRFALMSPAPAGFDISKRPKVTTLHDKWILTRLDATARDLAKSWSEFRMQEAAELIYHFIWSDMCDWYLEAAKGTRTESQPVILYVLAEALKLLHPICPHITEELWHELPSVPADKSLAFEIFPKGEAFPDAASFAEFNFLKDVVTGLRNLRSETKVPPSKKISVHCDLKATPQSLKVVQANKDFVSNLAKVDLHFDLAPKTNTSKVVVTAIEAGKSVEILIPLDELVDKNEEKNRLSKEIENLTKIVASQKGKLSNESFVSKAPKEVIDKEKIKLKEAEDKLLRSQEALKQL